MNERSAETLGQEILRLRTKSGTTLRKFAEKVGISAAYLSDIEHDRRRPSPEVMKKIVNELRHVGATDEGLDQLNTRLDPEIQRWVARTPEIRQMLRKIHSSHRNPKEILQKIEEDLRKETKRK